jgi:hypothetical protein
MWVRDRVPSYDPEISRLMLLMCLILPITLIVALLLRREPFYFFWTAFRERGQMVTAGGQLNLMPRWIFTLGWIACGLAMLKISAGFWEQHDLRWHALKSCLALCGGVGFFIAITSNDLSHVLDSIGMGMIVGLTYSFGVIFMLELRCEFASAAWWATLLLLQRLVLSHAAAFLMDSMLKQAAQKLCVLGLLIVVEKASTMAPEGFGWKTALEAIRR